MAKDTSGNISDHASELKGKAFEAVLSLALDDAGLQHEYDVPLRAGLVHSDFVISSVKHPKAVILSTHSAVEAGTNVKLWRNIDELFSVKSVAPSILVGNVLFPGRYREAHLSLFAAIFDFTIQVDETRFRAIEERGILSQIVKLSFGETKVLLGGLPSISKDLRWLSGKLSRSLSASSIRVKLRQLWDLEKKRTGQLRSRSHLFDVSETRAKLALVKRSLIPPKLLGLFNSLQASSRIASTDRDAIAQLASFSTRPRGRNGSDEPWIALTTRIGGGSVCHVKDEDLLYLKQNFPTDLLRRLDARMQSRFGNELSMYQQMVDTPDAFVEKTLDLLRQFSSSRNPAKSFAQAVIKYSEEHPGERNILFERMKSVANSLQPGTSYVQLANDAELPVVTGPNRHHRMDFFVRGEVLSGNGRSDISPDIITSYCGAVISRIERHSVSDLESVIRGMFTDNLEYVIATLNKHTRVNPLEELVRMVLEERGYHIGSGRYTQENCLASASGVRGDVARISFSFLAEKAGAKTLFQVAAAYDATHKHREWAGKLRVGSHRFDLAKGKFCSSHFDKAVLILDGLWPRLFRQQDVFRDELWSAGWTNVIDIGRFLRDYV
jgi:hypothetical protein